MIKSIFDKQKMLSANLFATVLFVFVFFLTFDSYSLTQVTPELVLLNLFGLPFARMELVSILFALTFAIGAGGCLLLKNYSKNLLSLSLALIGVISLVVGILDVNLLQAILPTMRISHVIMSLSRMTAFAVGTMGLFVGFNITNFVKYAVKIDIKPVLYALITALIIGILSCAENAYNVLYCLLSAVIFVVAILGQFANKSLEETNFEKTNCLAQANGCVVTFGMTFTVLAINLFLIFTLKLSIFTTFVVFFLMLVEYIAAKQIELNYIAKYVLWGLSVAFTIVCVFVQVDILIILTSTLIAFTFGNLKSGQKQSYMSVFISSLGAIIATILAYVFNHYVSEVTTYSNNRVVYQIDSKLFIVVLAAILCSIALQAFPVILSKIKSKECLKNENGQATTNADN